MWSKNPQKASSYQRAGTAVVSVNMLVILLSHKGGNDGKNVQSLHLVGHTHRLLPESYSSVHAKNAFKVLKTEPKVFLRPNITKRNKGIPKILITTLS